MLLFRTFSIKCQIQYRTLSSTTDVSDIIRSFRDRRKEIEPGMLKDVLIKSKLYIDFEPFKRNKYVTSGFPLKSMHVNQLAANSSLEDRWNAGLVQVDGAISSFLFTILDGHSGPSCAHALAWSLLDFVGASLIKTEKINAVLKQLNEAPIDQPYHIARRLDLKRYGSGKGYAAATPPPRLRAVLRERLKDYLFELQNRPDRVINPVLGITEACERLDNLLCSFCHPDGGRGLSADEFFSHNAMSREFLHVILSGAVGQVGRIFWNHAQSGDSRNVDLHLANIGDCEAILVKECGDGELSGQGLNKVHQGSTNLEEANRLSEEHPNDRIDKILRNGGRLLGELAPSRSFGDVRYKWPAERLLELIRRMGVEMPATSNVMASGPWAGLEPLPSPYTNPPYLTARPDVVTAKIDKDCRYLVLATDGLWDVIDADAAAKALAKMKPGDCPATTLLLSALMAIPPNLAKVLKLKSGMEERAKLQHAVSLLSLPAGVARYYRDDITVLVIEFDQ